MRRIGLVTAFLVACAGADRAPVRMVSFDTLPSGQVVVQNPATGLWDSVSAWRVVEDLRIGSADGDEGAAFSRIGALAVDDAGHIYVLDRQAQDVRVFDADGRHLRTLGGKGGGPGEFRQASGLAIDSAGRLWVVDPTSRRYTVFAPDGNLAGEYRREANATGFDWHGGFASGAFWDSWGVYDPPGDVSTRRTGFFRFDSAGSYPDTLLLPSFAEESYLVTFAISGGTGRMHVQVPFTAEELLAFDARGSVWRAVSDAYRVTQMALTGDTVRVVSRDYDRLPVTPEERERALERLQGPMAAANAALDASRIPESKPALLDIVVDDQGFLWGAPYDTGGRTALRLDVFDPEGRYLGQALTAMRSWRRSPRPVIRGGYFYYVEADSLDVPYVVRARIEGRK